MHVQAVSRFRFDPAIELKLAHALGDHDVRHLHWLRDRLADDLLDAVVVTTGPYAYRRPAEIAGVLAELLGASITRQRGLVSGYST